MKGTQRRLTCPQCGKGFFAWRPDDLPGVPVKCYFCGHQFADEAARRKPAVPASPAAVPAVPAAAPAAAPAAPETPAAGPPPSGTDEPAS